MEQSELIKISLSLSDFFKRLTGLKRFSKAKKKVARTVEFAFINFIIAAAANSAFKEDLRWQIENFKNKSRKQQTKLFPGFYLYIERYIFNSIETSQQAFREVLYQQFWASIDQNPALKVIFLTPKIQKYEIFKRFLFSIAKKSQRHLGSSEGIAVDLYHWLEMKNSFVSFSKVSKKKGTDLLIQIAHDFFFALSNQLSERQTIKIFHEAYLKQELHYQNLDCFHEILKLFPSRALDEAKYNLLSIQQIKLLLAEKVEELEMLSTELQKKNVLLKQTNEELLTQSEQLNQQNLQLTEAQELIHLMNDELSSHSKNLEGKVQERTKELAHSNELLTRYNKNLEQYTFTVSHQLKAPIARILGLTNLLKMVPANEAPVIASSVNSSAKELDGVFKDLVHALNFKKDVADLKSEKVELKELLLSTWKEATKNYKAVPVAEWNLDELPILETDPKHLTEALVHVYDNALKFHQPETNPHITTNVQFTKDRIEINIQDQGIGFDVAEAKPKLFTPFQRFNLKYSGRGMGLYFTKQHVSILGGDINIGSSINKGTHVKIELPLKLNWSSVN